jgi:ElaB/YqjD/DUF883 family membrane-anchored ribosome-binding protein
MRTNGLHPVGQEMPGVRTSVEDAVQSLSAQVSDLADRIARQTLMAGEQAGKQIREQPFAAMALAGLISGVIGYLMGRGAGTRR